MGLELPALELLGPLPYKALGRQATVPPLRQ
jgi:hypothetical protein